MKALFGTANIQADERGRIRIPSSFREYFGNSALYCMVEKGSNGLTIFGQDALEDLQSKMTGATVGETENKRRIRDFLSSIHVINEDKQKRFTLSQGDDVIFEVERNMVFIGMNNRLELWRKSDYEAYKVERKDSTGGEILDAEGKPLTW